MSAPVSHLPIVLVAGQMGQFRILFEMGPLLWVYAIGERPSWYVRDRWEWRANTTLCERAGR